jgi:tRNA (guanine37-N1)-methyltransferase
LESIIFAKDKDDKKNEIFEDSEIKEREIKLNYNNYIWTEALKKIIPKDLEEVPSGYEIIGNIAHLNLREKYLPYKYYIGQIIIDVKSYIINII